MTNFPISLDAFTNPTSSSMLATLSHAEQHSNANDAIEAIQGYLGVTGSTDPATVTGRLGKAQVSNEGVLIGTGPLNFVGSAGAGWTITDVGGTLTITPVMPQDLRTSATPTFYGLTLSGFTAPTGKVTYLGSDGRLSAGGALILSGNQLQLSGQTSTGGILIGGDAQIYRSAADVLRTPDSWVLDGSLAVGQTSTTAKATINQSDGVNFSLNVRHTGGTGGRHGLWVETTGTATNTTAFKIQTGSAANAVVTDGAGMTGFGLVPSGSHRVQILGSGNTSATDALKIFNSDSTVLMEVVNNGYVLVGTTTQTAKMSVWNVLTNSNTIAGYFNSAPTGTDATARSHYGIYGRVAGIFTETSGSNAIGAYIETNSCYAAATKTVAAFTGAYVDARIQNANHAGIVTTNYGGYFLHGASSAATGNGTITSTYGVRVLTDHSNPVGFVTDTAFGIHLAGSGTTNYPTTSWGIYETYGNNVNVANYLANPLLIGATTRGANLAIARSNSGAYWGTAGISFRVNNNTFTDTSTTSGGVMASNSVSTFAGGILAATNTNVTYTNPTTVYIAGSPTAGTNVALTNPWALWVNTGQSRFGGNVFVGTTSTFDGTATNANMLAGANATGLQVRGGTTLEPTLEFWRATTATPDAGVIGKIGAWSAYGSPRELSRIEFLAVGVAEDASSILFHTSTGSTLTQRMRIESTGRTVVQSLNLPNSSTPASATADGTVGDVVWDSGYVYICTATNTWRRAAISAW